MRKIDPIILLIDRPADFLHCGPDRLHEHYFYQDASVLFAVVSGPCSGTFPEPCSWASRTNSGFRIRHPGTVARVTDTHTVQVEPKDP